MEVSEAASNVSYKIDDRTGPWIDVKRWMDEQVREGGREGAEKRKEKEGGEGERSVYNQDTSKQDTVSDPHPTFVYLTTSDVT